MDTIRSRLSVLSLDRFEMTPEVVRLQQQMQNVMTFALNAAAEEPQCLEVAARDLALSLAHVYISKKCIYNMYSKTSDNGHSNKRTTSLQWTNCLPPAINCPYISTSDKGTTSEQWTKCLSPTCPLFRGSTVYTNQLHNNIMLCNM